MVATITKEEEELLIITDDEETTTDEINLNISDNKEPEVEWEMISFWWEEDYKNDKTEIESNIWSDDGLDFNFDLGWDEKNVTVEDMLWDKEDALTELKTDIEVDEKVGVISENNDTWSLELNFWEEITEDIVEEKVIPELNNKEEVSEKVELDFNLEEPEESEKDDILNLEKTLEKVEKKTITPEIIAEDDKKDLKEKKKKIIKAKKIKEEDKEVSLEDEVKEIKWDLEKLEDNQASWKGAGDTNTILNETIKKLQARKKEIVDIKKDTLNNISELKEEIKILQWRVRKWNTEVKHCDKETEKIEENIKMLRKMRV